MFRPLAFLASIVDIAWGSGAPAAHASRTHYGDPRKGCLDDERNVTITGVPGEICSPACHPKLQPACPTDVPSGVTAKPQCELTYSTGGKGCVLVCSAASTSLAALRAGDAQCGGATCQPIQGVGVCTFGGGVPTGLPAGCIASTTSAGKAAVSCAGSVSPEPGCENVNGALCCADSLSDTFSRLKQYRAAHPFTSLSMKCNGDFGGGDAAWAAQFGSLLKPFTGLTELHLDFSFNTLSSDAILDAVDPVVQANAGLRNFSIILEAANITDSGATRLGALLSSHYKGSALQVDLNRNNPGDVDGMKSPLTAKGAGKIAASIGGVASLKSLTLGLSYDENVTAAGVSLIATGLSPLKEALDFLALNLGYIDVYPNVPANEEPNRYFACLAKTLGSFSKLKTLVLNLDADINDSALVRDLGIHLACLPVESMSLPGMDNDQTDCHCGLALDKTRKCLIANKYYSGDLGTNCFQCSADANATVCGSVK